MLGNFFEKSKPITLLTIVAMSLAFYVFALFNRTTEFKLYAFPLFLILFSIILFIIIKNNLTLDNPYVFLFFVLLIGLFPITFKVNSVFYANFTLTLFLRKVYSFKSSRKVFQKYFDAGLWLGISFLIEPFLGIFLLLLYSAIFLFKQINIRSLLIPALGFCVPVFLCFTYQIWENSVENFTILFSDLFRNSFSFNNQDIAIGSVVLSAIFVSVALLLKTPRTLAVKNDFRKNWLLILLNFVLALSVLFLTGNRNGNELLYVFFPAAIILANGLELLKNKFVLNIVLIIFLVSGLIFSLT